MNKKICEECKEEFTPLGKEEVCEKCYDENWRKALSGE